MCITRAENRLQNSLRQQQAEIIDQYGEIIEETENTEPLGIKSDLHWQVHTHAHTPSLLHWTSLCLYEKLVVSLSFNVHYNRQHTKIV